MTDSDMDTERCDGIGLKKAFYYGVKQLEIKREVVNSLDILRIPNGNTGSNIHKTLLSSLQEIKDEYHAGNIAQQCARGALLGATGSSGTILANFLIGFANSIKDKKSLSASDIVCAFNEGYLKTQSEVDHIPDGNIVSSISAISRKLNILQAENLSVARIVAVIHKTAEDILEDVKNKNPLLIKMGISDSGCVGLFYFFDGMHKYTFNKPLDETRPEPLKLSMPSYTIVKETLYSTEFLLNNVVLPVEDIKKSLKDVGDFTVMAYGKGDIVKVFIRTADPKKVFDRSARFGKATRIRVDDLIDEQRYFLSQR